MCCSYNDVAPSDGQDCGAFSCRTTAPGGQCTGSTSVVRLSDDTNAHFSTSAAGYPYGVCCDIAFTCDDGIDNDGDGFIDFTSTATTQPDPGCSSPFDNDETDAVAPPGPSGGGGGGTTPAAGVTPTGEPGLVQHCEPDCTLSEGPQDSNVCHNYCEESFGCPRPIARPDGPTQLHGCRMRCAGTGNRRQWCDLLQPVLSNERRARSDSCGVPLPRSAPSSERLPGCFGEVLFRAEQRIGAALFLVHPRPLAFHVH